MVFFTCLCQSYFNSLVFHQACLVAGAAQVRRDGLQTMLVKEALTYSSQGARLWPMVLTAAWQSQVSPNSGKSKFRLQHRLFLSQGCLWWAGAQEIPLYLSPKSVQRHPQGCGQPRCDALHWSRICRAQPAAGFPRKRSSS